MADLISRQAAIEWLKKVGRCWKCCEDTKLLRKTLGGIINHVEKMPSVDAVEVVHGRWDVEVGMNYNRERICPVCNKHIESNYWNYCPNCGADMRGDA